MQPSDGKVHEISIDRIRQDTAMVTRGFFVLAFYPVLGVLRLMLPIIRDLPHIDPEKVGNPVLWLAVALATQEKRKVHSPVPGGAIRSGGSRPSGRIEEGIAPEFKSIGPFVGIGAPNEPLPELGAARAYFTSETWQDAIVKWVDMARLIIKVAGPTKWIRWELDTIVDCGTLSKLVILIPPGAPQARVERWQNLMVELQSTPWGPALTSVDPVNLVAVRFLADGKVSIVIGGKGRLIDYLLAVRLMLYQLQDAP